jgi:hypothetical protein
MSYGRLLGSLLGIFVLTFLSSCNTLDRAQTMPSRDDYAGYDILDMTDRASTVERYSQGDKIAVVVKNYPGYEWITPQYSNGTMTLDGVNNCCRIDSSPQMDHTKTVFTFTFIGFGETKIVLVARKKGLDTFMKTDPSDYTVTLNITIK